MSALCEDAQGRPGGGGRSGGALAGDGGEGRQLGCPLLCLQCTPEGCGAPAGRPGLWAWRVSRGRDRCRPGRREGASLRLRGPVSAVDARGAGSVQRMQDKLPVKTGFIVTVQGVFY